MCHTEVSGILPKSHRRPVCYMLVGIPYSGKSTWVKENFVPTKSLSISTDHYIEGIAESSDKTYGEVWEDNIKAAGEHMNVVLKFGIEQSADLYWDQTNLTPKSRKGKLSQLPKRYKKVAVVFESPNFGELERRIESRPEKKIPYRVLEDMRKQYTVPTFEEGFDEIIMVNPNA